MSTSPPERTAVASFGRDVVINVIGNLTSAAIIYLAGAAVGLIPRNPALIWTSLVVIFTSVTVALYVASHFFKDHRKLYLLASAMVVLGFASAAAPLFPDSGLAGSERVLYPIMGVSSVVLGAITLAETRRRVSRRSR